MRLALNRSSGKLVGNPYKKTIQPNAFSELIRSSIAFNIQTIKIN